MASWTFFIVDVTWQTLRKWYPPFARRVQRQRQHKDKDKDNTKTKTNTNTKTNIKTMIPTFCAPHTKTKTKTTQRQTIQRKRQTPRQRQTLRQWFPPYARRISGRRQWGRRARRGESQAPCSPRLMTIIDFFRWRLMVSIMIGWEGKICLHPVASLVSWVSWAKLRAESETPNRAPIFEIYTGDSTWQWWYLLWLSNDKI